MSLQHESPLTFRTAYASPLVSVRDYKCRVGRGGPMAEEHSESTTIVLLRRGVFCKHIGKQSLTADVNQAVFFAAGSTYRVSHPAECGDRGTVFAPAPWVLTDMIREFDPASADRAGQPLPFGSGPCDAGVFWAHRQLLRRIAGADAEPLDTIWVDETSLQIMADVLASAFARDGVSRPVRRVSTRTDHADRAEAARMYMSVRMSERITLDDVAGAVHLSPFHLTRVFRQRTGVPVHRYLTQLRLRASLERLADGAGDLTALAIDLGFSSHSHFTDTFRREFGCTPSAVRGQLSLRARRELRANLEARVRRPG